jgi:hypothetical protein
LKTKKLIALLQAADPSGDLECCVDNLDIHYVVSVPAYYDGELQVLQRDDSNPYYNIVGAKYVCGGHKLKIVPLSIADAIFEDPSLPVDYSGCGSPESAEKRKKADDATRQQARNTTKKPNPQGQTGRS